LLGAAQFDQFESAAQLDEVLLVSSARLSHNIRCPPFKPEMRHLTPLIHLLFLTISSGFSVE